MKVGRKKSESEIGARNTIVSFSRRKLSKNKIKILIQQSHVQSRKHLTAV